MPRAMTKVRVRRSRRFIVARDRRRFGFAGSPVADARVIRHASQVRTCILAALFMIALTTTPSALSQSTHIEASIRASQARAATRRGELEEAARLFRESLELDASPRVLRELALLLERMGNVREAAALWTRFATLAPATEDR